LEIAPVGDFGFFGLFGSIGAMVVALFVGPMGQAIGRRIAGEKKDPNSGLSTGEMAAERIAQLENRLREMEERLDFAERVLLKSGEPEPISENNPR
jgi:hypothetical protein